MLYIYMYNLIYYYLNDVGLHMNGEEIISLIVHLMEFNCATFILRARLNDDYGRVYRKRIKIVDKLKNNQLFNVDCPPVRR